MVPEAGIEPARPYERGILSPLFFPYKSYAYSIYFSASHSFLVRSRVVKPGPQKKLRKEFGPPEARISRQGRRMSVVFARANWCRSSRVWNYTAFGRFSAANGSAMLTPISNRWCSPTAQASVRIPDIDQRPAASRVSKAVDQLPCSTCP